MRNSLCAICDATNQTVNICSKCKRDPANAGWNWREDAPVEDLAADYSEALDAFLNEQEGERGPEVPPELHQIARLALYGEKVRVPYVDKRGRRRGTVERWKPCTVRRIAEIVGRSSTFVFKWIAFLEKDEKKFHCTVTDLTGGNFAAIAD
jgi:hypothetical protein